MYDRARLIELFRQHALKFGDFTLASGQKSSYYLDGRLITLHAEGLRLIAEGILERLEGIEFAAVGGMSIGADPIVGGVLTVAAERRRPLVGFLVRKQAKEHGTKRAVEGSGRAGSTVVIVEDVITTGGSARCDRPGQRAGLPRRLRGRRLRSPAGRSRRLCRSRRPLSQPADHSRPGDHRVTRFGPSAGFKAAARGAPGIRRRRRTRPG